MNIIKQNLRKAKYNNFEIVSIDDIYIIKDLESNKFYKISKNEYSFENLHFEEIKSKVSPIAICVYGFIFIIFEIVNSLLLLNNFNLCGLNAQKFFFILIIYFLLFVIVHEFGHVVMLKKFGGSINKIGFKFNYIFPSFFVRMNDLYFFNKREKILVHTNGLFLNLTVNTLIMLLGLMTRNIYLIAISKYMCIDIFYNTLPFLNSDGYKILITLFDSYELKSLSNSSLLIKIIKIIDFVFVVIYSILFINNMINV